MQKQTVLNDKGIAQIDLVDVVRAYAQEQNITYYRASRLINNFNKTTVIWRLGASWLIPEALMEEVEQVNERT